MVFKQPPKIQRFEGAPNMQEASLVTVVLKLTRETKNTYRCDASEDDAPVGNIYIQKKAMPSGAPPELELQLRAKSP